MVDARLNGRARSSAYMGDRRPASSKGGSGESSKEFEERITLIKTQYELLSRTRSFHCKIFQGGSIIF